MTTLPAKGNMVINSERCVSRGWAVQHAFYTWNILLLPKRKGRIIRHEIIPNLGFLLGVPIWFDFSFLHYRLLST
jgi:hypothetical protein